MRRRPLDARRANQTYLIEQCETKEAERLDLRAGAWKDLLDAQLQMRRNQLERRRKELLDSIQKRSGLSQKISDLEQVLNTGTCPICGRHLSAEHRPKIGEALGKAEAELQAIDDSSAALQDISGRLGLLSKIRGSNAKDRLRQAEKDLQGYQVRLTQIENDIERLSDEVAAYDTADIARKRILQGEKYKEEGRLQKEILEQKNERKTLVEELAISQRAIEGLTKNRTQRSTIKVSLCADLEKVFFQSIERLRKSSESALRRGPMMPSRA